MSARMLMQKFFLSRYNELVTRYNEIKELLHVHSWAP